MARLITGVLDQATMGPSHRELSKAEKRYLKTLTAEQAKEHLNRRRYPQGQFSRGGANRSAKIARERRLVTKRVTPCLTCGGVTAEIRKLTSLFPLCECAM